MRHLILTLVASAAVIATSGFAQAGGTDIEVKKPGYDIKLTITEKVVSNATEGHYVFIASADLDGAIKVEAIENAAICTGVHPHFGLTKPSEGGFSFPAYAAYYGPYATRQEALTVRTAVKECVQDAFIKRGRIQRF